MTEDETNQNGDGPESESNVTRRGWKWLFLETITVLVGVLLAFLVEEWREDYQIQQEVELAKERIFEEIRLNYDFLQDFKQHVDERYKLIKELKPHVDNTKPFTELRHHFIGYRFVQFQSSAWQRANANQLANRMDEELLTEALKIYNWNDTLTIHNRRIDQIRFTSHFYDPKDATIAYEMSRAFIGQQVQWANAMDKIYTTFLKHYGIKAND